jgi:outer membrane protein OmpA-like peptidoglycan-associated protein
MHRMLSPGARAAALLSVVAFAGCSEDLGPVTATWNTLQGTMASKAVELHKQYNDMAAMAKSMAALAASDGTGQALMGKLTAALAGQDKLLGTLDGGISSAATSVQNALKAGKVAEVQKAIDDAKSAYDGTVSKLGASGATVAALLGQLKAHNAQLAADAARVSTVGGRQDFSDIDFKPGKADFLFDRPNTQANLDKLLAFVNSCPQLVVNIIGYTSNEGTPAVNMKLSVDRAKAVQKWLTSKGVSPKKIRSVSGKGATDNIVVEPAPKSAAAKAMPPAALEELRRKNRRIAVTVAVPCPAK